MKKVLIGIAAFAILALSSCGKSSPSDFAKAKNELDIKEMQLETELYEYMTKHNEDSYDFSKEVNDELEKLQKEDAYKDAKKALKEARKAYEKSQRD